MHHHRFLSVSLIVIASLLSGCGDGGDKPGSGGGQGNGGGIGNGTSGGQHLQLMNEACDLALKILAERESGKSVDEVNKQFAEQVADIDARIAKLPKLTEAESIKMINTTKPLDVERKFSDLALKGTLHETGKVLKLPNYALADSVTTK